MNRFLLLLIVVCCIQSPAVSQQLDKVDNLNFDLRDWVTKDLKHTTKAKLIDVSDGNVNLLKADGTKVSIPLIQLSLADQGYCAALKSRVDGKLNELLSDGIRDEIALTTDLLTQLKDSIATYQSKLSDIQSAPDTTVAKDRQLESCSKEFDSILANGPGKTMTFHGKVIDLRPTSSENRSGVREFELEIAPLDLHGFPSDPIAITGLAKASFADEVKVNQIVRVRGMSKKSANTFFTIPLFKYTSFGSRGQRKTETISLHVNSVVPVSDELANILSLY